MTTLTPEQFDDLQGICLDNDMRLRSYSGRGMMGNQCLGIITSGSMFKLGLLLGYTDTLSRVFINVSSREDSAGLDRIVYFPSIAAPEETELG